MKTLQGISVSSGIGRGEAFVVPEEAQLAIPQTKIKKSDVAPQWEQFLTAVEQVKRDIQGLNNPKNAEQSAIFDSYSMMLNDEVFIAQIKDEHAKSLKTIEYVVYSNYQFMATSLRSSGDAYLSQRADDICDVFGRVVNILQGRRRFSFEDVPQNAVIAARTLLPTDAVLLEKKNPQALVLEEGGANGHIAILARNYGIPAVFGISGLLAELKGGEELLVDGDAAEVCINPDRKTAKSFAEKIRKSAEEQEKLEAFRGKAAQSKDGVAFALYANIGAAEEAEAALEAGADGIGLFRTEFLFMGKGAVLSEDEQFAAYKHVLEVMRGKPVVIRTIDSGADKLTSVEGFAEADSQNPLLGCRAIRLCLQREPIFRSQLRALYRAGVYGDLHIEFPLVCCAEELEQAIEIAESVKAELRAEGTSFNADVPLGIMVETASAALASDFLAQRCKFFSVGTNDLTQYSLGVNRDNPKVAHLFNEYNPAVLRMIALTAENAQKAGIPLSVCGEMASTPEGICVLAGMGIRRFSMGAKKLNGAKQLLAKFTVGEFEAAAARALANASGTENRRMLRELAGS